MAIDGIQPTFREIPTPTAVPEISISKDREVQLREGLPTMEVVSVELEALRWRKREDILRDKWARRRELRNARHHATSDDPNPESDPIPEDSEVDSLEAWDEASPDNMSEQTSTPARQQIFQSTDPPDSDDDVTGTLLDDRL